MQPRQWIRLLLKPLPPSFLSAVALSAALFAVLALFRYYTLSHHESAGDSEIDSLIMLRGLCSDALAACAAAFIAVYVMRLPLLRGLWLFAWAVTVAGNHEYILTNDTNLSLLMAEEGFQKDFIFGSVLTASMGEAVFLALAGLIFCLCTIYFLLSLVPRRLLYWLIGGVAVVLFVEMMRPLPAAPEWMMYNFAESSMLDVTGMVYDPPINRQVMAQYIKPDLSGEPLMPLPASGKPNILIIAIEGYSAVMMNDGWTPNIQKWAQRGLYYRNYLNPSRRTSNGMYSMMCGDYPFLSGSRRTSKGMQVGGQRVPLICLPRVLAKAGYTTVYMQPTHLDFDSQYDMNIVSGFTEQYDESHMKMDTLRRNTGWGLNDSAFFENIELRIAELNKKGKPWFITTQTVGTHHPYQLPTDYRPTMKRKQASFAYMDEAMDRLLTSLEKSGVLKNTLVLITSDESSAPYRARSIRPETFLPENRGFMLALTPQKQAGVITQLFGQPDLFMTLADYVGADTSHVMFGRSLFRRYDSFRPMIFGSIYNSRMMIQTAPNHAVMCLSHLLKHCKGYTLQRDDIFHTPYRPAPLSPEQEAYYKALLTALPRYVLPVPVSLEGQQELSVKTRPFLNRPTPKAR